MDCTKSQHISILHSDTSITYTGSTEKHLHWFLDVSREFPLVCNLLVRTTKTHHHPYPEIVRHHLCIVHLVNIVT
jgi:hypothetical protein